MDRNSWGATAVDALSTAIIMEDAKTVDQILSYIPTIDFTTTIEVNSSISLFETNIRYLGGLMSGTLPRFFSYSFTLSLHILVR